MNDDTVRAGALLGNAAQLFVGEMHGIAGLECDHLVPFAIFYFFANLHRGAEGVGEFPTEIAEIQHLDRPGDTVIAQVTEYRDTWVRVIRGPVHLVYDGFDLVRTE